MSKRYGWNISDYESALTTSEAENKRLREEASKITGLRVCVIDLAGGVFTLRHAVADGMHDERSLVGDTALAMQESLLGIGIDVRKKPLNFEALKPEQEIEQ